MITQQADTCKSCEFQFIRGFYVCLSVQKIVKESLQIKLKEPLFDPLMNAINRLQAESVHI